MLLGAALTESLRASFFKKIARKMGATRGASEAAMTDTMTDMLWGRLASCARAMKKRDEVHRMADANKAFSHFRF